MWSPSPGLCHEIGRILQQTSSFTTDQPNPVWCYGHLKAACDARRGQYQTVLDFFKIPWSSYDGNQDVIGLCSLYIPDVRKTLQDQNKWTDQEAKLFLPDVPQELQDLLDQSVPLGTDWGPVPPEETRKLLIQLKACFNIRGLVP